MLIPQPCQDSPEMAQLRRAELAIPRSRAAELGEEAVAAIDSGEYVAESGSVVDWSQQVHTAHLNKITIPPEDSLPEHAPTTFHETRVMVANQTTLGAARELVQRGGKPFALNLANGVIPGGGFLGGARAQEETLCRSSALYKTLVDDPMYDAHSRRPLPDSTDWAIYSPGVPVFRRDDGTALDEPWLLSFLTCAAPYAPHVGQPDSGDLLRKRIQRVLAIARAYGYSSLVLGAWGCGAFKNDPVRTAQDFRGALEGDFDGAFNEVVFAVADWSPDRRFLGPFCEVFSE